MAKDDSSEEHDREVQERKRNPKVRRPRPRGADASSASEDEEKAMKPSRQKSGRTKSSGKQESGGEEDTERDTKPTAKSSARKSETGRRADEEETKADSDASEEDPEEAARKSSLLTKREKNGQKPLKAAEASDVDGEEVGAGDESAPPPSTTRTGEGERGEGEKSEEEKGSRSKTTQRPEEKGQKSAPKRMSTKKEAGKGKRAGVTEQQEKAQEQKSSHAASDDESDYEDSGPAKVANLPPFRRPPKPSNTSIFGKVIAEAQPELHIIGQILGAMGHLEERGEEKGRGVSCKWFIDYGRGWSLVSGAQLGHTQTDFPPPGEESVWCHPIDVHLTTSSIQGWPRLQVEVWRIDSWGRSELAGYGFSHIPARAGMFELEISTWRPLGTSKEEMEIAYIGGSQELVTDELVYNLAWADRCKIRTIATGKVFCQVDVLMRNFSFHHFES